MKNQAKEKVILVDENNRKIGEEEKIKAHKEGKLHRAFSIFVFNSKDELLLQKRAKAKYHSGGLWSNTCCSHPRPGESDYDAANRRLIEEMGFSCKLKRLFCFTYKTEFDNGLIEHEYDCVFIGKINESQKISPNPIEVKDYKWISMKELKKDIKENPGNYSYWLKVALKELQKHI